MTTFAKVTKLTKYELSNLYKIQNELLKTSGCSNIFWHFLVFVILYILDILYVLYILYIGHTA